MKKIFFLLIGLFVFSIISCGTSKEELEKQKKIDDSIFESERNTALDNANKLLCDTTIADTTVEIEEKVK